MSCKSFNGLKKYHSLDFFQQLNDFTKNYSKTLGQMSLWRCWPRPRTEALWPTGRTDSRCFREMPHHNYCQRITFETEKHFCVLFSSLT